MEVWLECRQECVLTGRINFRSEGSACVSLRTRRSFQSTVVIADTTNISFEMSLRVRTLTFRRLESEACFGHLVPIR